MVNKVIALGNVGKDPELKYAATGTAICRVSIAVTEKYKEKEETTWFNFTFFGKAGEIVAQYVKKGDRLYAEGKLRINKKDDKTYVEIIGNDFALLGGKKKEGEAPAPRERAPQQPDDAPPLGDDDIPF